MTSNNSVNITWLGHASTRIDVGDGRVILIDPWISSNPSTPESAKNMERADVLLISHGHEDNLGDAIDIAKQFKPYIIAANELCGYLTTKGVENCHGGNTGGSQDVDGIRITMVNAIHSSSVTGDNGPIYTGLAVGFVLRFPDGFTIYHAGDTDVFEGMQLIGRLYSPDIALLPIGDYFTMGPEGAAEAVRLLGVKRVIPVHYGTFPVFTGTVEDFQMRAKDIADLRIIALKPGESVDSTELA
jgi:L-ascorbate metabolism protein UlaG (beta-lactamase superfamily)